MPDDDNPPTQTMDSPPEEMVKLPQQVEISDAGPCKKHVKVTVDRVAIDLRMDEKFTDLVRQRPAQVPGFRLGKAPRKIIVNKFRKEVANEVKNEILMASLEQLAEENTLSPLSPPDLDPNAVIIPEEGPMVYEFDIEVRPEFDLPNYQGLKIRRPIRSFTDADADAEARKLLERYGQIVPKDTPVEPNDLVSADLVVTYEGKELSRASEIRVKIEDRLALSDGIAEGFAAKMTGATPGETRTVDIILSQDVANPILRGVAVQAAFTVKDVKTVLIPELTPAILELFGVRSVDQFRELMRLRLERGLEYAQRQSAREQVMEQLAGGTQLELPRDLLVRQSRKTLSRKVMEMRSSGMTDEQIAGRQRVLEQDAVKSTASALKEHFVLQKIAEIEKIEIDDQDIDIEIERIADQTNESPRKVRARMEKEDLIEALATELLERKALDLVLQSASYEDVAMSSTEAHSGNVATVEAQVAPSSEESSQAD